MYLFGEDWTGFNTIVKLRGPKLPTKCSGEILPTRSWASAIHPLKPLQRFTFKMKIGGEHFLILRCVVEGKELVSLIDPGQRIVPLCEMWKINAKSPHWSRRWTTTTTTSPIRASRQLDLLPIAWRKMIGVPWSGRSLTITMISKFTSKLLEIDGKLVIELGRKLGIHGSSNSCGNRRVHILDDESQNESKSGF